MSQFVLSEEEIQEFKAESIELIDQAEECLLALDKGMPLAENYNSIFRALHSIKGAAGMMNWDALQSHVHTIESMFQNLKNKSNLEKEEISFFLRGIDAIRSILDGKNIQFDYNIQDPNLIDRTTRNQSSQQTSTISSEKSEEKNLGLIVAIDDEPDILEILADGLVDAQLEVKTFTSPLEAIEFLKTRSPDVVITDMTMPKMSGLEVLKSVHSFNPDIPVIFLSGNLSKDALVESIKYGIFGAIEKPFSMSNVTSLCLSAIEKYKVNKLLNQSINLLLYQYNDLEKYLEQTGQTDIKNYLGSQIKSLIESKRKLKKNKTSSLVS